jgi:hypothetical protein
LGIGLHWRGAVGSTLIHVGAELKGSWKNDNESASRLSSNWQPLRVSLEHLQFSPQALIHPAHCLHHPGVVGRRNSNYTEAFHLGTAHGGDGDCLVKGRELSGVLGRQGEQIQVRELPRAVNPLGCEKAPVA